MSSRIERKHEPEVLVKRDLGSLGTVKFGWLYW